MLRLHKLLHFDSNYFKGLSRLSQDNAEATTSARCR